MLPPTTDALPAALVGRQQWVCWRTKERDGNPTKVPIIPGTTQFASTTDPETWRSFETAREGVTTTPVDGLGFVFTADDPLIGIAIDACRDPESGDPATWAEHIIADLDSYTEISPSGTGYHILVTAGEPTYEVGLPHRYVDRARSARLRGGAHGRGDRSSRSPQRVVVHGCSTQNIELRPPRDR
ncbi:MAG: hypothetical protein ABEH35_05340 [Haloarculaceae archaeon]